MVQRRKETIAEKSRRLVSVTGGTGGMPSPPPKFEPSQYEPPAQHAAPITAPRRRAPTRLAAAAAAAPMIPRTSAPRAAVPQHTPAQLQAFVAQEQQKVQAEIAAMQRQAESPQAAATMQSFAQAQKQAAPPEPDRQVHVSAHETKPANEISSWDMEVIEMAGQLDPAQLVMDGAIAVELEILGEQFTASVQSFRQSDWVAIRKDVNEYRRGLEVLKDVPDPENPGETKQEVRTIIPFPDEVVEFSRLRQLAQGVLGVDGFQYPEDWGSRAALLEQLASPAYEAMSREFTKFLSAVGTMFPDKPTREKMEELKARLGKAQAQH